MKKKKKLNEPYMTVVLLSKDRIESRNSMPAFAAKKLFSRYVCRFLGSYSQHMREIQLLNNAVRLFQSFKNHF